MHRFLFPRIAKQVDDEYGTRVLDASTAVYDCLNSFGYDGLVLDCPSGFVVFFVEQAVHTNMLREERISEFWQSHLDNMVDTCALIVESGMFLNNTKSWGSIYAQNLDTAESWWLDGRNIYYLSPAVKGTFGAFMLHSALSAVRKMDNALE